MALVTKLWAILDFVFSDRTFLPPRTLPYEIKKAIFLQKIVPITFHFKQGFSLLQ